MSRFEKLRPRLNEPGPRTGDRSEAVDEAVDQARAHRRRSLQAAVRPEPGDRVARLPTLCFTHDDFVRIHETPKGAPAMAANVSDTLRDMEWITGEWITGEWILCSTDAQATKPKRFDSS